MDATDAVSVKSLDEKGTAGLGERLQFGFRNIQSAEPCQVMDDLLPRAAVIFIMLGRELGDPQGTICGLHRSFGSCASQGGAGGQKLTQPFFIQAALIVLESDRGVFQRPKVYPWRCRKRFIVRKKFAPFFQAEPQRTHTGFIVDPQQEVDLGELTGLAVLFASVDGLLALHQQTPPAIRTGVGKQAKELLVQRHILPPAVESQIRVQREGTLGG